MYFLLISYFIIGYMYRYVGTGHRPAPAGDALFSCFLHYYAKGEEPTNALHKAITFASYKIGDNGAANGFLSEKGLEKLILHQ